MNNTQEKITIHPSWKNYFWAYFFGVLLTPMLIGIVVLWITNKKKKNIIFTVTDNSINTSKKGNKESLDLIHILSTSYSQNQLQKLLGIGDIKLQANVSELILEGIEEPTSFLEKIDIAIAYQNEQRKASEKITPREATHNPGTLDKMDYLTGLWQQGLISDEDYDTERKKF